MKTPTAKLKPGKFRVGDRVAVPISVWGGKTTRECRVRAITASGHVDVGDADRCPWHPSWLTKLPAKRAAPKKPAPRVVSYVRLEPLRISPQCWAYEERGGLSIYHDHMPDKFVCLVPLRSIRAYLRRIPAPRTPAKSKGSR